MLALERQVRLEAEHNRAVLEVADLSDLANVLDDQLVRLAHVCAQGTVGSAHAHR